MQAKLKERIHIYILDDILEQFHAKVKKGNGRDYEPI